MIINTSTSNGLFSAEIWKGMSTIVAAYIFNVLLQIIL